MNSPNKIYDLSFKRMIRLSGKMLVKFVNKVFGKRFPLDSEITFLDTNTVNKDLKVYEKDLYFIICGERFHLEAQAYYDDMLIRLFNYAVSDEEGYKRIDDSHAVFKMPQQAVVFLKDTDKSKDKLYIKLILPDEQEIEYSVHAVRSLGYTPQELIANDMEILLPFQILRLYGSVKKYSSFSEEQKTEFLEKFTSMCRDIITTLRSLKETGKITNDEHSTMITIIRDLEKHIYSSIDDIANKGADSMLNEEFISSDERARAEAEAEEKQKIAELMIEDGECAEKIIRYTGIDVSVLKSMAQSLGKALML
jgi:hypothetical protein